MEVRLDSDGLALVGHLARPQASSAGSARTRCGLVVAHGFPKGPDSARGAAASYPALADRLAADTDWVVLTVAFRGCGGSEGEFSMASWEADLLSAITRLGVEEDVAGVFLAGFGTGGALALCAAGADPRVRGVASFAGPADFDGWASDARRFLDEARSTGAIGPDGPPDVDAWVRELRDVRPLDAIGKIPPRPILLVHGSDDDQVPAVDARALAEAAHSAGDRASVELRVLTGAGHGLRHDPRAIAILLGWLDRQRL